MSNRLSTLASVASFAVLSIASHAGAEILDISAADTKGVAVTLLSGHTYKLDWLSIATGGIYDSAIENGRYTNAVSFRDPFFASAFQPGGSTTVDILTVGNLGTDFASSAQSLSAYLTGPINFWGVDINSGVISAPVLSGTVMSGFTHTIPQGDGGVFHVLVFDPDGNRTGNTGGVSLRITDVSHAVPEPATWTLMIGGFCLAGSALRRRRAAAAA